jgi:gliding-associated putative ABC transporter substrate-binding component GldG
MFSLFKKDFFSLIGSTVGAVVIGLYLVALALFLWVIPGEYNLADGGLAVTETMFLLSSQLLLILIPALTMRVFAEEKRQGTWDMLRVRPISNGRMVMAKFLAVFATVSLGILLSVVHPILLSRFSSPVGNIDWGVVAGSYGGLLMLAAACTAVGIFASAISANQVVAFIVALLINAFLYYGFELLSGIPGFSFFQSWSDLLSLTARYKSLQRGVIDTRDLFYFISLFFIFTKVTAFYLDKYKASKSLFVQVGVWAILLVASGNLFMRFDLTAEKRYSLSDYTKSLLAGMTAPVQVNIYLDGELNAAFTRLKNGTGELIDECNNYSGAPIYYQYLNPSATSEAQREKIYSKLIAKGMKPVSVNDADRQGKLTQKLVFPWAEMICGKDTMRVPLLKTLPGKSAHENLNASLESLELNFTEALQWLTRKDPSRIAFLEGHGELPEPYVAEALNKLGSSYVIDRGVVGFDPQILSPYKVLVIAGPQKRFTEADKYVLDQYVMHGGRIFWLVDGVYLPQELLAEKGETTAAALDLNLTDYFFNYGVRINPNLLQDAQCISIPLKAPNGSEEVFPAPWCFSPTLQANPSHLITRNISTVKADFASSLDLVGDNSTVKKEILLATSSHTHILSVPANVSYQSVYQKLPQGYFDAESVPVAVLLEGKFTSLFNNRFLPDSVQGQRLNECQGGKMIVASTGSIIRNEIRQAQNGQPTQVPLGYVPFMDMQFGNADFIVNAVEYLAGDQGKIALRSRQFVLRLLDQAKVNEKLTLIQVVAVAVPVVLLYLLVIGVFIYRKRRYAR